MVNSNETIVNVDDENSKSSEMLSAIYTLNPDAISLTRATDGKIIDCNQVYLDQIGYTREEVIGRTSLELNLFTLDERKAFVEEIQRNHNLYDYEVRVKQKNDIYINILYSARFIMINGEKIILSIGKDISERIKTEEKLKESENKFRLLFETMVPGVVYQDANGQIISINPAAEKIMGYTFEEIKYKTLPELKLKSIHEDGTSFLLKTHPPMIALKTGKEVKNIIMGVNYPSKEGYTWLNINAVPEFLEGEEKPFQVYTTFEDITERKNAEKRIKYQANLLSQVNDAVIGFDSDLVITYWNNGAEQIYGYSEAEALGKTTTEILRPTYNQPDEQEKLIDQIKHEGLYRASAHLKHKSGAEVIVEIDSTQITNDSGDIEYVAVYRDITEHNKAELALKESEERLRLAQIQGNVGVWDWNKVTNELNFTPELEQLYGLTPGTIQTYQDWRQLTHPDDIDKIEAERDDKIAKHELFDLEFRIFHKSGDIRWLSAKGGAIYNKEGDVLRVLGINSDITERKKSEEKIRHLADVVESSNDAIITKSLDGFITSWNKGAEKIYGYSPEEILGQNISILAPHSLKDETLNLIENIKLLKRIDHYETLRVKKNGTLINVSLTLSPVFNSSGKLVSVSAISRDITEKKKLEEKRQELLKQVQDFNEELEVSNEELQTITEELKVSNEELIHQSDELLNLNHALRESENKFSKAFHSNPAAMTLSDDKDRWIDVNDRFCELTGYSKDELIGHNPTELNLLNIGKHEQYITDLQEKGLQQDIELEIITKTGEKRIIVCSSELIELDNEIRHISFLYDVTHRKKTENKINKLNSDLNRWVNELNTLFEMLPMSVAITYDKDSSRIYANPVMEDLLGMSPGSNISKSVPSGEEPDYKICLNDRELRPEEMPIQKAIDTGKPVYDSEYDIIRRDGRIINFHGHAVPLFDDWGNVRGAIGAFDDITEHKQAEEKLKKTMDDLKRSNRELEQFAYVSSHDLQEPLRMVSSFTQLLERRYKNKLDSDADEYIDFIVEGAQRMKILIDDLLTFSRVSTHAKEFERVDFETLLDEVISNLSVSIEENKACITHDPLPTVMADKSQMGQVFQNLIGNAIKFHGSKPPLINITAYKQGILWKFEVSDNGIGIDPDYQKQIFEVFKRLHTRNEYPGSGIGLSVSQKIIHRHGGQIGVKSKPGEGSTFYFTIPDSLDNNN
jgi:PAS domain S-box-containing protein